MNKKGVQTIETLLYFMGSLCVGALMVAFFSLVVPKLLFGSVEDVMAKDISLAIMTISASPYDLEYSYEKNTEGYEIRINDKEVFVKSRDGYASYRYFPMKGITVNPATVIEAVSMPLILKNSVLSFKTEAKDYTDSCAEIPQTFKGQQILVKMNVQEDETGDVQGYLKIMTNAMKSYAKYDVDSKVYNIEEDPYVSSPDPDLELIIGTSSNDYAEIKYYDDLVDKTNLWYYRIACYIQKNIEANYKTSLGEVKLTPTSEKQITIELNNPENFTRLAKSGSSAQIPRLIINSLNRGITN